MLDLIMQSSFPDNLVPSVASIVAFAVLLGIVWNISRRFTTLENDAKVGKEEHFKDVKDIKDKVNSIEREFIQALANTKVDRKEEITKAFTDTIERISGLQKQLDTSKSDMKDVSTRVTTVNTKTEFLENQIEELKDCDKSNMVFITKWNQRIEDSVSELRRQILQMITGFHGNSHTHDKI